MERFTTVKNNGQVFEKEKEYTNACMWISIRDYLRIVRNDQKVTVTELRRIAIFPGKENEDYNDMNKAHQASLKRVLEHYKLRVTLYVRTSANMYITQEIPEVPEEKYANVPI